MKNKGKQKILVRITTNSSDCFTSENNYSLGDDETSKNLNKCQYYNFIFPQQDRTSTYKD